MNNVKHLEMLQSIINRLAGNSFLIKGWFLTISLAELGFYISNSNKQYILVLIIFNTIVFWIFDSFYLSAERKFRCLFKEIGIGHATLSRIESGKQPDMATFIKICTWLGVDPNTILGFSNKQNSSSQTTPIAHFRAKQTMSSDTARHLAELILAVQKAATADTSS